LSRTSTGLGAKRQTLYFSNFNIKNENFKILILHRMIRKSPDKQWNCQNSILFHET
jgi:hypothetical protein